VVVQITEEQEDRLQLVLQAQQPFLAEMEVWEVQVDQVSTEVEVEVALQARVVQVVQVQFTMAILVELAEPPEQVHLEEQLVEQEEMIKVKPRHSMAVMDQHQELAVEE